MSIEGNSIEDHLDGAQICKNFGFFDEDEDEEKKSKLDTENNSPRSPDDDYVRKEMPHLIEMDEMIKNLKEKNRTLLDLARAFKIENEKLKQEVKNLKKSQKKSLKRKISDVLNF